MSGIFALIGLLGMIITPCVFIAAVAFSLPGERARHPGRAKRLWICTGASAILSVTSIGIFSETQSPEDRAKQDQQRAAESQAQAQVEAKEMTGKRQAAQDYWATVMSRMSVAYFALQNPLALGATNSVDLVEIVKNAGALAHGATVAAGGEEKPVPEGWDDVRDDLQSAGYDLKSGCDSLLAYIDDQKPTKAAEAKDSASQSRAALADAIVKARDHYVKMGGKAEQLSDYGVPKP